MWFVSAALPQLIRSWGRPLNHIKWYQSKVNLKMFAIKFDIQKFDASAISADGILGWTPSLPRAGWRKYYSGGRKSLNIWRKKFGRSWMRKPWQLFNFVWRTKYWMNFLRRKQHPRCGSDFKITIWRSHWWIGWFWSSVSFPLHAWRYIYEVSHCRIFLYYQWSR